jgi:hypothetical protein
MRILLREKHKRFLRSDTLTSVTKINVPWDDTVSTGIYVLTFRGQPLLPSSEFKNVLEVGGSRFM